MREIQNFPIRGDAWITEINGRHFVIWKGRTSGNQIWAVAYQTNAEGRPTTWSELARERTEQEALAALHRLVDKWAPALFA